MIKGELIDGKFDGAFISIPKEVTIVYLIDKGENLTQVVWKYSLLKSGTEIEIYTCDLLKDKFYHKRTEIVL